jgi:hypothetical protein
MSIGLGWRGWGRICKCSAASTAKITQHGQMSFSAVRSDLLTAQIPKYAGLSWQMP